jgi:hypothetical protein
VGIFQRKHSEPAARPTTLAGTAKVVEVRPTSDQGDRALSLHLLVKVPGHPPFTTTLRVPATVGALSHARAGAQFPAAVDPASHAVELDWPVAV